MILTIHFICILNQGLRLTAEPFHADHIYISLGSLRDSLARLLCTHASQFSAPMLQMARFPWTTFSDFPLYIYQYLKSELKPRFEITIETASILSTLASLPPIPFQMFPLHFIDL